MLNIDALSESAYAQYDPQNFDEEKAERAELNDAIDQINSNIETVISELEAVKQNFSTRKFNTYVYALEEIRDELEGMKTDD